MNHLILIAHGSRAAAANDEIRRLADGLRPRLDGHYQQIHSAFLELATPSIPEAIDQAVAAGATTVTVLPYFLAVGRHVAVDVPELVAERQKNYPQVCFVFKPYLGMATEAVMDLVTRIALSPTTT